MDEYKDQLIVEEINSKGFGIVPKLIMQDKNLSISAKAIYSYFCSYAGGGTTCFPTRKKICYDLNISNDTFSKYLKELIVNRYIACEQKKQNGKFSHNIYTLLSKIPCPKISDTENMVNDKLDTNNNNNKNNSIYKINKGEYRKQTTTEKKEKFSPQNNEKEIVELYREICKSYPDIIEVTETRIKKLRFLMSKFDISKIKMAFKKAENTPFLKGKNKLNWIANFDFLIDYDNIVKLLEGFYDTYQIASQYTYEPSYNIEEFKKYSIFNDEN